MALAMVDCQCQSWKSVYSVIYEPGGCEAIVQCTDCGQLWYTLLFERMSFTGDDILEEYQIPITIDEYQAITKTPYEDLSLDFLSGRKGRVIHEGGIVEVDADFALGRCGRKTA